jgi:hypothetical protein
LRETSWTHPLRRQALIPKRCGRRASQHCARIARRPSAWTRGVQRLCQFTGRLKAAKSPYRLVTGTTPACATSRMPRRVGLQLHAQQCVDHRRDRRCRVAPSPDPQFQAARVSHSSLACSTRVREVGSGETLEGLAHVGPPRVLRGYCQRTPIAPDPAPSKSGVCQRRVAGRLST